MMGPNGWSTKGPSGEKGIFSEIVPKSTGMLKARFEHVVTRFGPWKIPKCLENGPFCDQKWVQNGSKTLYSKKYRGPFGVNKQVT